MFPSLDIAECAKVAADEFLNSDLVIENIEDEKLGLFLAVAADKDRLRACDKFKSLRATLSESALSGQNMAL